MGTTKETEFSEEGVPLADQERAHEEADDFNAADAEVDLHDVGPSDQGEERRVTEDEAEQQAEIINEVVETPKHVQGDRLQDHLAFDNARRDEAVAQGVVKTTQEALWEIAREEEAQAQGVNHISETTQKALFRESRAEEVRAEKWEESQHAPVEPVTVSAEGVDQLERDKQLEKETAEARRQADEIAAARATPTKVVKQPARRKTGAAKR